ncbi:spore cortex biosynthesis protein YabQ [Metabacillus sp. RGM 3146]|uniref:spore cortex biosynthesis protein YabQ n=1 Tax=Metabacillus sp. RGM 3146 TaxID=3401092 RepID=UPI003B99DFF9
MTLTTQFYTMLAMIGMGGWLGAALDTYGRFLKRSTRARWFVFLNDVVFWVLQGLCFFYVLLLVNEGELRLYLFLAILCGYAFYQGLLKEVYRKLLNFFINTVVMFTMFLMKTGNFILIKPITGLLHLLFLIVAGILNIIWKIIKWASQLIYFFVKILLAPFRWLLILLWKMIPSSLRTKIKKFFSRLKGVSNIIKNIVGKAIMWGKRIFRK